jgi:prepilin-type N-terminal cleavage/methylation domain-containing protein
VPGAVSRALYRRLRQEDGLTLSELLVVLAIMGIILAALAGVLSMSITQSSQIQEQSILQTEVRATLDTMAREIRQAYTGDTSYPIETATTTALQFRSPDKAVPAHNRRIAYRLSGGQIDRAQTASTDTDGAPWTGFAWTSFGSIPSGSWVKRFDSVKNAAVFSYYDKSGTLLTGTITPSAVYRVVITVTVATKAAGTRLFTYSTSTSLRWEPE